MRRVLTVIVLGSAVLLPGCGSGSPHYLRDRDAVLRFKLSEYRIQPEDVSVRAGEVKIVARNVGRLTHNLQVESIVESDTDEPVDYGRTDTAQPGETVRATLHLKPGKYRLTCTIANHDDLGQFGELLVTKR